MSGLSAGRAPLAAPILVALALGIFAAGSPARAVGSSPPLANPVLEARYQHLIEEVRCLQCQDLNIANSPAPLAGLMRRKIRSLLLEVASNRAIKHYLVARYGDFVLFKPPVNAETLALWWGPYILLALACLVVAVLVLRHARRYRAERSLGGGP
jgi:cytochrome c-type biogenesis protein CcmH